MQAIWEQFLESVKTYAPSLIGALVILIVGWLVAKIVSALVLKGLRRTRVGHGLTHWLGGEEEEVVKTVQIERRTAKLVYYLVMLLVVVGCFQILGLTIALEPINNLLNTVFGFIPQVAGAAVLLLIAWIIASIVRLAVTRVLSTSQIDRRLGEQAGLEEEKRIPLTETVGNVFYWLVFLLFLPAVLSALKLEGLLGPVQSMIDKSLSFLPNILMAILILLIGWFLARVVRQIVTNLLAAVGLDRLSDRVGLGAALGEQGLSGALGLIVYILILIPVLLAALSTLQLEAVTQPTSNMLNVILEKIPSIFAAVFVVVIAYVVGRVVAGLVTSLLTGIGFNAFMVRLGLGKKAAEGEIAEGTRTPSAIVGAIALVGIMLFAIIEAFNMLGFTALVGLTTEFTVLAGHIILGFIILGAGLYVANLAARAVRSSGTAQADSLASLARIAIMLLVGAMALRQMGLANEIINMAFGLLLGALAVAVAIAFGVGGREMAARKLEKWAESTKSEKP